MTYPPLSQENAEARYDADNRIVFVRYHGALTADASSAVYEWLETLIRTYGSETIYGEIWDFREVTQFMPDNIMDARKNSRRINLRMDTKSIPVAMVVKDFFQEEILRGPMKNVPENQRKSIVRNMNDAHAFLDAWHARQRENTE